MMKAAELQEKSLERMWSNYMDVKTERDAALARAERAEAHMYVLNGCVLTEREEKRQLQADGAALLARLAAAEALAAQLGYWVADNGQALDMPALWAALAAYDALVAS